MELTERLSLVKTLLAEIEAGHTVHGIREMCKYDDGRIDDDTAKVTITLTEHYASDLLRTDCVDSLLTELRTALSEAGFFIK